MQRQIFSRKTITNSPLVIVGMPRCGSTIFTQILNQSRDLLIINDFYYLQYVDAISGFTNSDRITQEKLVQYISKWLIRRIERDNSQGIGGGLVISQEQEAKIKHFLQNFDFNQQQDWASILQQIMDFTAITAHNKTWGYNTPQDYLNLELLNKTFPSCKFIFVIRDCRSMLGSYKFIIKEKDYNNDQNRYHPVLQSLAWRTSVRTFFQYQQRHPHQILLVRYQDLVNKTDETLHSVQEFIDVQFPDLSLSDFGNNSSFRNKKRKTITNTEAWLCEKIAGQELEKLGYTLSGKKPRLQDLPNLLFISLRVTWYYLAQVSTSANIRKRIWKLVKKIVS